MKLNNKQKEFYFNNFTDEYYLESLRQKYHLDWEIIYDPTPNEYDYALVIDGIEQDRLDHHFVRGILNNENQTLQS